jgi:DNA-binding transcriptional regulator YdaS (Cro superfamily)
MAKQTAIGKAIQIAGGVTAMAEILKTSPQVVSNWRSRNSIPADKVLAVEAATGKRVTRHELSPGIFGRAA